jgi:hypothetical protein
MSGAARRDALHALGGSIDADARSSNDAAKVKLLAASVHDLAAATK